MTPALATKPITMVFLGSYTSPTFFISSFLSIQEEKKKVTTHQTNCTAGNRPRKAWFPTDVCFPLVCIFSQCNCSSCPPISCRISLSPSFAVQPLFYRHAYSSNHSSLPVSFPHLLVPNNVSLAGLHVLPLIRHDKLTKHF